MEVEDFLQNHHKGSARGQKRIERCPQVMSNRGEEYGLHLRLEENLGLLPDQGVIIHHD